MRFSAYPYTEDRPELGYSSAYLLAPLLRRLGALPGRRIFEVGCGNGALANRLTALGYSVTGIDPSERGIALANAAFPGIKLFAGDAYDPLADRFGTFPIVLMLEVIEHVYLPHNVIATCRALLEPGGALVLSTPYHGWLKNVAVAVSGKFDHHVHSLQDGGHIKFWSVATMTELLRRGGFNNIQLARIGRVPALAKTMLVTAVRT